MLQVIFICGSSPSCGPSVAGLPGAQARMSTGKPVIQRNERQKLLEAGWQRALQTLSDAEHATGLARIVAAFDSSVDHLVAMERMLHQYAVLGKPEIDSGKTAQFINTDRRLGNTGTATFYMQMALGVMGSYIEGGPSGGINLHDPAAK